MIGNANANIFSLVSTSLLKKKKKKKVSYILYSQLSFLDRFVRSSLPVLPSRSQEKRAKHRPSCFLALYKYANSNGNVQGAVSYSCVCVSLVQIENIDACLSFLAAKGVNIQGLSSEGK